MTVRPSETYRYDIALERGAGTRLQTLIIALMVYFATLTLAGTYALSSVTGHWVAGLKGSLTIEITPPMKPSAVDDHIRIVDKDMLKGQVDTVIEVLKDARGIVAAKPLPDAKIAELLDPWLGKGIPLDMLPLPALIDVKLDPAAKVDLEKLQNYVRKHVPNAAINDHTGWLKDMFSFTDAIETIAYALTVAIALLAILIIVAAVKARMAIHKSEIELLHLVGASDGYIANQFQHQALVSTLKGTLIGAVLGVVTVLGLAGMAGGESAIFPGLDLEPRAWAVIAAAPVICGLVLAVLTARVTALRELSVMP